jgi:hypothetical protein
LRQILFIVGQSAASSYLAPLWGRWLAGHCGADFRIALHPTARAGIGNLSVLPLLEGIEDEVHLIAALGDWRPDLVVTSLSGKMVERSGYDLARRRGIPVWQFVDTWYDYALRLERTNGPGRRPDRLLVIDDRAGREAIDEGIPRDIIVPVGNPAWENVAAEPAKDGDAVLFVSQPITRHWGNSLGYTEHDGWKMVCDAASQRPDLFPRLIFAPHPDEDASAAGEGAAEKVESGSVGVRIAGCVLGLYSSVMVDALLAGRKVISVQPNAGAADKCSLSRHGFIGRARSVTELVRLMEERKDTRPIGNLKAAVANSCIRLEKAMLQPDRSCVSSA